MATQRQKQAMTKMVENGGNASKAMIESGYSPKTAHTPSKLTDSKGFQDLLEENGLTDELLIRALVEDIKSKQGNRKVELELAFKLKGYFNKSEDAGRSDLPVALVEFVNP